MTTAKYEVFGGGGGVFSVGEDEQIFGLWGRLPLSSQ